MKIVPAAVLLGLGSVGVGGWYKFSNLKPKTLRQYLEWQGLRLISDSETNYWKAILDENGQLVSKLNIDGIEGIKSWCRDNLDSESYEDLKIPALSLCVDNPSTVKARLIQLYGDTNFLINGNDADNKYKVAYVFRKHIDGFNALIGYSPEIGQDGKEVENLEEAKTAFKAWCTSSLTKPIDETLVLNVKELCTPKKFSTIKQLIELRGESGKLLTDNKNSNDLNSKHEAIKAFDSWKADNNSEEGTKDKLKEWCTTNESKNFYEESVFSETYPKFRFRCLKDSDAAPQ
ncbi:hypothetical protein HF1_10000 [Mycoplasma haemofelis str. Langford 1]|uniref:Uncharacterized protein n=1 Tax=Mycoplasma haemofelis (strain Langford 1) TaxID=941640 RepID=E8ZIN7_MYCHL|nr:hypothetical protein [Mycoplasma haemofelis]CBY93008.1 hypothetical protein HF1_10000 [Mycoplasma haemofelis str. Langford 1]